MALNNIGISLLQWGADDKGVQAIDFAVVLICANISSLEPGISTTHLNEILNKTNQDLATCQLSDDSLHVEPRGVSFESLHMTTFFTSPRTLLKKIQVEAIWCCHSSAWSSIQLLFLIWQPTILYWIINSASKSWKGLHENGIKGYIYWECDWKATLCLQTFQAIIQHIGDTLQCALSSASWPTIVSAPTNEDYKLAKFDLHNFCAWINKWNCQLQYSPSAAM